MHPPTVRTYMTAHPFTIEREEPLSAAKALMEARRVRHLPVVRARELVGLLSERDLHLVESLNRMGIPDITVEDAMTPAPYGVDPDAPLRDVVVHMRERRINSAVVLEDGAPIGIFTAHDAYAALADLLEP